MCTACKLGKFKTTVSNAVACASHTVCAPGFEPSPIGTASKDSVCVACVAGTFKAAAGSAACAAHKICGAGETGVGAIAGTATADRRCVPCVDGSTYKTDAGDAECKVCTAPFSATATCAPGAPFSQACTAASNTICPGFAAKDLAVATVTFGTPACARKTHVWVGALVEALATVTGANGAVVTVTFQAIDSDSKAAIGAPISVPATSDSAAVTFLLPAANAGKHVAVIATLLGEAAGKIPGTATKTSAAKLAFGRYKMGGLGSFGRCTFASGPCGVGTQVRPDAVCLDVACGANIVETNALRCLSDNTMLPASSKPCFEPCETTSEWVCKEGTGFSKCSPELWTACSKSCGGGTQARTVEWMKFVSKTWVAGTGTATNKPLAVRTCSMQPCETYKVVTGPYSACPRTCKVGAAPLWQTRSVTCVATLAKVQVAMGRCDTSGLTLAQRTTIRNCAPGLPACASPFRSYGRWGKCSEACGGGVSERTPQCVNAAGVAQAGDSMCSALARETVPTSVRVAGDANGDLKRKCNTNPCKSHSWHIGPFGACSATCASGGMVGTSQRSVLCQEFDPTAKSTTDVADGNCTASEVAVAIGAKPRTSTECGTDPCDPCAGYICGYAGTCDASTGQRVCSCPAGHKEVGSGSPLPTCERNAVPACGGGQVLKIDKSACFTGFAYKTGAGTFAECIGASALLDSAGGCCESGALDACGVCDGTALYTDAHGICCPGKLDAKGACCTGTVDDCGVCNGSDECKVVVVAKMPVPTVASQGPVTTANYMSPTTPQRLAYDIAAKPGIAAICAGGNTDQVTIDAVEIEGARRRLSGGSRRLVAAAVMPTFSVLPPKSSSGAQVSLVSVTEAFAAAAASGADSPFKPVEVPLTQTSGVCGNKNCETGERCDGTNAATCCAADCPLGVRQCPVPAGSTAQCGGQGTCMTASGACSCFTKKGYTGPDCSSCMAGFSRGPISGGKVVCEVEVIRVAADETTPPTRAPTPARVTMSPTPVPTPAAPTPAPWPSNKEMVVKFTATVTGFSVGLKTFTADVQTAFIAAIAAQVDVTDVSRVKIFRLKDGSTAAESRRLAGSQVSFDVEIAARSMAAATALAGAVDGVNDAALLNAFRAELVLAGESIPADLAVTKTTAVITEATIDSALIIGAVGAAMIAIGITVFLWYCCWYKKHKSQATSSEALGTIVVLWTCGKYACVHQKESQPTPNAVSAPLVMNSKERKRHPSFSSSLPVATVVVQQGSVGTV